MARTLPSANPDPTTELRELQKPVRALPRALKGDWRDLKAVFELAGIFPPKDNAATNDP